jgi:hypothetical protein
LKNLIQNSGFDTYNKKPGGTVQPFCGKIR